MNPRELVEFLNEYLSIMTDVIIARTGTIDKFIGDAIMTIFGTPVRRDDDARRALQTAVDINNALVEFNKRYTNLKDRIKIGIGIHTGEVVVGNIWSDKRLDYTVIGDNVNLSSRIESLTVYYGCPILIPENTYVCIEEEFSNEEFLIREIDKVVVKGKIQSVGIYEIMLFSDDDEKQKKTAAIQVFEQGLQLYRLRDFYKALSVFERIKHDKASRIYKLRCEQLIKNPPDESWDGTFVMKTN